MSLPPRVQDSKWSERREVNDNEGEKTRIQEWKFLQSTDLQLFQLVEINCEWCNYWYSTTCMFLVQITGFNVFDALITF